MTFSVVVTDGLRALGFPIEPQMAEDWFFLWRQVGKVLGVEEPRGFPVESTGDGADFFQFVRAEWSRSEEGAALARSGLELMAELLPGTGLDGIGPTLVRHLAGERCADLLDIEPADWTRILVDRSPLLAMIEGLVIGEHVYETPLTPLLQHAAYGTMVALSEQQREGKNGPFSVPRDFLDAWRNQVRTRFRV